MNVGQAMIAAMQDQRWDDLWDLQYEFYMASSTVTVYDLQKMFPELYG